MFEYDRSTIEIFDILDAQKQFQVELFSLTSLGVLVIRLEDGKTGNIDIERSREFSLALPGAEGNGIDVVAVKIRGFDQLVRSFKAG